MLKNACPCGKVAGIFVIIAAINSGVVSLFHVNYCDQILSGVHLARVFAVLTILAALMFLASYVMDCPCKACKK